jgi:hypothetical protein
MTIPSYWEPGPQSTAGGESPARTGWSQHVTTGNWVTVDDHEGLEEDAGQLPMDVLADTRRDVRYITLIVYLCTFIVGFAGNTLVLYVIGQFPTVRRKSVANYYIWNLALADELCVLALPLFCWATYM